MNIYAAKCIFYMVRFLRREPIYSSIMNVKGFDDTKNIQEAQWIRLEKVIRDADKYIPYYRETWQSQAICINEIKNFSDFSRIPLLTKDIVRNNQHKLKNKQIKLHDYRSTSGSSGAPLKFYKDRLSTSYLDAVMYHAYSWHGIKIGDKQIRFWGIPNNLKDRLIVNIKDLIMNRIRLSAFDVSKKTFINFAERIERFNPDYFYGYPSMIYLFAKFLREEKIKIHNLRLKAIISTGEQLFEHQKNIMQDVFHTKVINEYGCAEVGVMGFECAEGNLHVMSPNIYLEVVNKDGEAILDEEGAICVTELNTMSVPFIRYKIGDRGIYYSNKCKCGLKYPIFNVLHGRIDDFIITPDGRKVYDAILAYTFKKGIISFKAIQKDIKTLYIYLIPDKNYNKELEQEYINTFKKLISSQMEFIIHCVNEITPEPSGKLRYFRSEIL